MTNVLENEINSFSKWFKWVFYGLFFVYLGTWLFTIHLSNFQKQNGLEPVLPIIPKDSEEYLSLTESIIQNHSFANEGKVSTVRAPGYPIFAATLKTAGNSYFAVTLVQVILLFFSAAIIRRLGILFASQKVGELSSLIFLLNPVNLVLSLVILTDILFLFAFIFGFYLAVSIDQKSKWKIFFASFLFAIAIYIRPMGVFALPIFATPFLISKTNVQKKIKSLFLMALIILALMTPWMYRNYRVAGVADFTSFKSINLVGYAVPLYLSNLNHTTEEEERVNIENKIGITRDKWRDLKYSKEIYSAMEKIILEHPLSYLKFHFISSLPFLFSSSVQYALDSYKSVLHIKSEFTPGIIKYLSSGDWRMFFNGLHKEWWKMLERTFWVFVYVVALFGFWKQRRNLLAWAFVFIPAYLMLLAGPAANARYFIQALPFILILFSVGLMYIKRQCISTKK